MSFNCPPWIPVSNPRDLAVLGKLSEEVNELGAALSRIIIQGIDQVEPVTGVSNRAWLQDEIADVQALIGVIQDHFNLELDYDRIRRKINNINDWISKL